MSFKRIIPELPSVERDHREIFQANNELKEVFDQCAEELEQAVKTYRSVAEHRQQLVDLAAQLQQVYDRDTSHWKEDKRVGLLERWTNARKTIRELNMTLAELTREINNLNTAMAVLNNPLKKPEIAES